MSSSTLIQRQLPNVPILSQASDKINPKQPTLSYFFMDTCHNCTLFTPTFLEFLKNIDGTQVKVKFITDKAIWPVLHQLNFKIDGVPTVVLSRNGHNHILRGRQLPVLLLHYRNLMISPRSGGGAKNKLYYFYHPSARWMLTHQVCMRALLELRERGVPSQIIRVRDWEKHGCLHVQDKWYCSGQAADYLGLLMGF